VLLISAISYSAAHITFEVKFVLFPCTTNFILSPDATENVI
jgi:hypothetical protein